MKKINTSLLIICICILMNIGMSFTQQTAALNNEKESLGRRIAFVNQLVGLLQKERLDIENEEERMDLEDEIKQSKIIQQKFLHLYKKLAA